MKTPNQIAKEGILKDLRAIEKYLLDNGAPISVLGTCARAYFLATTIRGTR